MCFFLEEAIEDFTNVKEKPSPKLLSQKTAPQIQAKEDSDKEDSFSEDLLKQSVMIIEKRYKDEENAEQILFDEDTRNETLLTRKQNGLCFGG